MKREKLTIKTVMIKYEDNFGLYKNTSALQWLAQIGAFLNI